MKRFSFSSRVALLPLAVAILVIGPVISILGDGGANHQVRNLHFGVSGGNVNDSSRRFCCSGTLGALIQDNQNVQYVLSNNHVVGLAGAATAGDDISQPGLIDNGCRIATVVADFTTAPALSTNVDAAIAQLRPGQMDPSGFIEDIGVISSVVKAPAVGLAVQKSGRTTGHTTGTIGSINATVSIKYPTSCGGKQGPTFTFTNQIVINSSTFSAGGDSGSLVVTNNACAQPVGLLFAGSSTSTICNRIGDVLNRVGTALGGGRTVSFVGISCSAFTERQLIGDNGPSAESIEFATASMRPREKNLMSRPGVIGVGVGALDENSMEAAIIVYIDRDAEVKPKVPRRINGVRVKVVETDAFVAY